mmetsp:Transcript_350/g.1177  ORF Transcript_350/g.1177 Transcript_350/m.1177 type:complete len:276 (-) Transcript_350:791-1618(-)
MSISNTYSETKFCPGCALLTRIGNPVVCFDQINAIFDPKPNFPRVCLTPYFVPDNTRPNMFGMSLCSIPFPLSFTVILKYDFFSSPFEEFAFPRPPPFFPLFAFAAAAFSSCISTFASLSNRFALAFSVSKSSYKVSSFLTCASNPIIVSYCVSVTSSTNTSTCGRTPMCSAASNAFSMNSLNVVYNDFPAFSNPAMPLLSWKNSAGDFCFKFASPPPICPLSPPPPPPPPLPLRVVPVPVVAAALAAVLRVKVKRKRRRRLLRRKKCPPLSRRK